MLCDIRKHATDKQKRLVRDMMRDLFEKGVSSDDDEQLMADLKKECTDLREELRRQQATYREESYLPGKNTVDAGIALMTSLIDLLHGTGKCTGGLSGLQGNLRIPAGLLQRRADQGIP